MFGARLHLKGCLKMDKYEYRHKCDFVANSLYLLSECFDLGSEACKKLQALAEDFDSKVADGYNYLPLNYAPDGNIYETTFAPVLPADIECD